MHNTYYIYIYIIIMGIIIIFIVIVIITIIIATSIITIIVILLLLLFLLLLLLLFLSLLLLILLLLLRVGGWPHLSTQTLLPPWAVSFRPGQGFKYLPFQARVNPHPELNSARGSNSMDLGPCLVFTNEPRSPPQRRVSSRVFESRSQEHFLWAPPTPQKKTPPVFYRRTHL